MIRHENRATQAARRARTSSALERGRGSGRSPLPETVPKRSTGSPAVSEAVPMLVAALPVLVLYLATLHAGLPAGDSGELITVAATGGVAHPPGYPLYAMLGGAWLRLMPFGSAAWRLNLLSAVCMAGAVACLTLAVRRVTGSAVAALIAAWSFALSAPVWKYAIVAEVFALNALLAAGVLLVLAGWNAARAPEPARQRESPVTAAVVPSVLAFFATLGITHHHTLLLLAVPAWVATFALEWRRAPIQRAWLVTGSVLAGLAGLAPLAWIPWASGRSDARVWGDGGTWRGFLALLLRADYGTFRLEPAGSGLRADRSHAVIYLESLPRAFGWVPLGLAVLGGVAAARRHRAVAAVFVAYAAGQAWFFTRVGFPSDVAWLRGVIERFHVLPNLVLAFLSGQGAAWLLERLRTIPVRRVAAAILIAAALAIPIATRYRAVDQRDNRFTETLGRGILASLPPNAVLFVQGDVLHNSVAYLGQVEKQRPDVTVVDQQLMTYAWYVHQVRARHPGLLPAFDEAQRIELRDGRVVEGLAIARSDGTTDLLTEHGEQTIPSEEVLSTTRAAPESLYRETRATLHQNPLIASSEDSYSGFPGSRNIRWLDRLAGRRPVAMFGSKDDSWELRYWRTPIGFTWLAHPRSAPPSISEQADRTLAVLDSVPLDPYFRHDDPVSFEEAEKWRFAEVAARAALLLCEPQAASAVEAHPLGHARLLEFARRFESLDPTPRPATLRAIGFLRTIDAEFRDLGKAVHDLERYRASSPEAAADVDAQALLERLKAQGP